MAGSGRCWWVLGLFLLVASFGTAACRSAGPGVQDSALPTPPPSIAPPQPSATWPPSPMPPSPLAGWTDYLGVNQVNGLTFAPDGALWAATTGGAARWDLDESRFTQYTVYDGLVANYATDVALAPDGDLWISTLGGVSRLQGETWTSYTRADGLASDSVLSIEVTPNGALWAGTTEGASRFDGKAWTTFLAGTTVYDLALAPDGDLWLASQGAGPTRYSPADDTWTSYTVEQGLPDLNSQMVAVGPDGSVWTYVLFQGVYRLDGNRWQKAYDSQGQRICDTAFVAGAPWFATCGSFHGSGLGLVTQEGGAWVQVTLDQGLPSNIVHAIAVGSGERLVAATDLGLALYQDGQWRTLRGGPAVNRSTCVAVTHDGAVWLGYGSDSYYPPGGGASRYYGEDWDYWLEGANVSRLAVDPLGTLWAGTGCSLNRFGGREWQTVAGCEILTGNVLDIAFTSDGSAWVASGLGLARYDGQAWHKLDKLAHALAVSPDGRLWMAGWDGQQGSGYVALLTGPEETVYHTEELFQDALGDIVFTPDGYLWGTSREHGVVRFDGQDWSFFTSAGDLSLSPSGILAVAPDGSLWVGTGGGLARLKDATWTAFRTAQGISGIAFAPDGSLWLTTLNGAAHFRPTD